jgi:beta-lactamase superfamily II metal-dependent hydrolase
MKQVIFNVGGALSVYTEFENKKLLVDVGKSDSFNPIQDFLSILFKKRGSARNNGRYCIDQLIISHPHNDHISAIEDFNNNFFPELLTCPNDNRGMKSNEKINWKLIDDNPNVDILRKMIDSRTPPLRPTNPTNEFIYYLPPQDVENDASLTSESYCNNISIATYLRINGAKVFLPGDIMKLGMEMIIKKNSSLRNRLAEGVDVLIAPHHGLRSSFSLYLFNHVKNNKTRCLNIVSEKATSDGSSRQVDSRYSSTDYCSGANNFSTPISVVCQKKTSVGHIFIDYSIYGKPRFEIINDGDILIKRFL